MPPNNLFNTRRILLAALLTLSLKGSLQAQAGAIPAAAARRERPRGMSIWAPTPTTRRTALTRAQCSLANSCHRCGTYPRQARFLSRTRTILIGMSSSPAHWDALGANIRPRLDFYKQVSRAANHAGPTTTPLTTSTETLHMSNHRPLRPQLLRGTRVRSKAFRPLLRVSTR